MRIKSPIVTLLVGVALAVVVMVLNQQAAAKRDSGRQHPTTSTSAGPTSSPPTSAPAVPQKVTYAGKVTSGGATIAIAVKNGTAIAYFCDGRKAEAWLQGTASSGQLTLTGSAGASLTATYSASGAVGTVTATGKQFPFSVNAVSPPSGLYRAVATVRNARVVGGWIVLPDGTQVGVLAVGDTEQPAPALDLSTTSAVVDGTTITAAPVDGTSL
jgi:hypothetical protein